ncbi:hypothetical protein QRX60_33430 [Amycolatopsis mongoliensis]|uniref:Uncharacterized protein n=1 Tax=Amycolatopsis mongoliensis TaxID=715475 RepID=A0A9Y2NBW2_9PSEU|nr:hypothetical protein [Amycolatopsis sp. 4-36]WIX98936.1 hypothetical protein QRX60_33430 [Amycolatopsis sp. 4-36]
MSKQRGRRIGRHTAEQVLRGAPVDGADALTSLLAAAAAPPRDGELAGEQAAVTAFLEAAHARAPRSRSPSMLKSTGTKLRAAKVAAAAAAIFAVGGVAAAAVTGVLPLPAGGSAPPAPASDRDHPGTGSSAVSTTTQAREGTPTGHQPAPSPSLVGLCRAYDAGDKAEHGKALESPAFTELITAAGDRTKVDGYCAAVLEDEASKPAHATGSPSDPGHPDNGKSHPAGPPGTHPAGRPSTHPSGPPATRPAH